MNKENIKITQMNMIKNKNVCLIISVMIKFNLGIFT